MPPTRSAPFKRSSNACTTCRRRKVKCSGSQPCEACIRGGIECTFGTRVRRGYSETYVNSLLDTIKQHEQQETPQPTVDEDVTNHVLETQLNSRVSTSSVYDADIAAAGSLPSSSNDHGHAYMNARSVEDGTHDDLASVRSVLAHGPAFETRASAIIGRHPARPSSHWGTSRVDLTGTHEGEARPDNGGWKSTSSLYSNVTAPALLTKAESTRLFEVFVSLLGINQHFLDPRKFADSLDTLYETGPGREEVTEGFFYIQYLLVMAMGMLIGSPSRGSEGPPGNGFFKEALRRLPPTHELGSHGIISVEILCLVALYLQWCDHKQDAYLYIGIAARLAVALGCALPRDEQEGVRSEKCHRNRVWWTVYMLDRRLSAALGLPMGVDERQIRADLPRPGVGFQPPQPMIINVQIARVTGEIMTSFYDNTDISQRELVKKIQSVLNTLYRTGKSIPPNFKTDFDSPRASVSRTSASLYLMLFQAIILCIRPIILQCVKDKVEARSANRPPPQATPIIIRLCNSCREAALKSIRILTALRKDESIALFGYFDLDAAFSAAFILAMMGFVENDDSDSPPEGLRASAQILRYLCKAGNKAAEGRLKDLKQFCGHVWDPDKALGEWEWLQESDIPSAPSFTPGSGKSGDARDAENGARLDDGSGAGRVNHGSPEGIFWPSWESMNQDQNYDMFGLDRLDDFNLDLGTEMTGIYDSFNDPNLPLTGVHEADWAAIGNFFQMY